MSPWRCAVVRIEGEHKVIVKLQEEGGKRKRSQYHWNDNNRRMIKRVSVFVFTDTQAEDASTHFIYIFSSF